MPIDARVERRRDITKRILSGIISQQSSVTSIDPTKGSSSKWLTSAERAALPNAEKLPDPFIHRSYTFIDDGRGGDKFGEDVADRNLDKQLKFPPRVDSAASPETSKANKIPRPAGRRPVRGSKPALLRSDACLAHEPLHVPHPAVEPSTSGPRSAPTSPDNPGKPRTPQSASTRVPSDTSNGLTLLEMCRSTYVQQEGGKNILQEGRHRPLISTSDVHAKDVADWNMVQNISPLRASPADVPAPLIIKKQSSTIIPQTCDLTANNIQAPLAVKKQIPSTIPQAFRVAATKVRTWHQRPASPDGEVAPLLELGLAHLQPDCQSTTPESHSPPLGGDECYYIHVDVHGLSPTSRDGGVF